MENDLSLKEQFAKKKQSDIFWEAFPEYLVMGMTSQEYWEMDSRLTKAYQTAYKRKQKARNSEAWLYGVYVLKALQSGVPVGFMEKGKHLQPYPSNPIGYEEEKLPPKQEKKQDEQRMKNGIAWMQAMAAAINRKQEHKEKPDAIPEEKG